MPQTGLQKVDSLSSYSCLNFKTLEQCKLLSITSKHQFLSTCDQRMVLAIPPNSLRPRPSLIRNAKTQNGGLGITGGSTASIEKFPYQAAVSSPNGYFFLGSGAIVGKKYILTSAYIVNYYETLQVRVGSANSTEGGQLLTTEKIMKHYKYGGTISYDVALLKLSKEIKYGKTAKPIKLATKIGKNTTSAVVSGFGYNDKQVTEDLLQGKQNVITRDTCQSYYSNVVLDESNSCAYSSTVCPCVYDIGDPLVQKKKLLGWYLGGTWCCYSSKPQIYTSVPAVNKWVKEQMKREGYDIKEDIGHYYGEDE